MNYKSQGSIEVIATLSLLILFIVVSVAPFISKLVVYKQSREVIEADYVCNRIYSVISSTLTSGKDFQQILDIPEDIMDIEYNISFYPDARYVIIYLPQRSILCPLQSSSIVNATNSSDPFVLLSKKLVFSNRDSTVMVEEL